MLPDSKKSKRRRYIRYAIELDAVLQIDAVTQVRCIIQDFCTGGFLLKLTPPHADIPLHKNIKILFAISRTLGGEHFELEVQTVHLNAAGLGVMVEKMPVAAFTALKNKANAGLNAIHRPDRNSPPNKLDQENFSISFKHLLQEKLPILVYRFFEALPAYLDNANHQSNYFRNSFELADFTTTLKHEQDVCVSEFCSTVISQIDYIDHINHKNEEYLSGEQSLSLVEKADFEDWLTMSAIIRKIANQFEEQLNQLNRELSRVFGVPKSILYNPISPATLCDSFREILIQFEIDNKRKGLLYQGFAESLIAGLADLYEQSITLLLEHETAEKIIGYPPVKYRHKSRQTEYENNLQPGDQQEFWLSSDNPAYTTEFSVQKSVEPVSQITGKLLNLLNEMGTDTTAIRKKSMEKSKIAASETPLYLSSEEIMAALAKINFGGKKAVLPLEAAELNQRLQQALGSLINNSKTVAPSDVQHLELYGKFFETLVNQFAHSDDIQQWLEKIRLPLMSLPLQGNDFLDSEASPVRNVLNQLALLEPAIKANKVIRNINVKNTVEKLIERIAQESSHNPGVFAEVEQELEGLSKLLSKSTDLIIKRIIDAHEGQQKLEIAKRWVQEEIDKRIAGKSVPSIIPLLLESGWQQLLVIAELNKEKNQDETNQYWAVIDSLIAWLYEQESILNMQAASIKKTIQFIESHLPSVCPDVFLRHKVIDELSTLLLGVGQAKTRKPLETVKIAPAVPQNTTETALDDPWALQVEQLSVGEWLTIFSGSQGFEPMKLVWIGDMLELYVLVNRDALHKLEFSKAQLIELLRNGEAIKADNLDEPLMDRATQLMLQKMHEKLIHHATHDPVTELLTRDEFIKQLKTELTKLSDSQHILCQIDVLDFRVITNVCEDGGGEQLLKRLAQLITDRLRAVDLFARIGEESFAILFKNCSIDEASEKAEKLVKLIGETHFQWQEKSFAISVSMGLVAFKDDCVDIHQLLRQADTASLSAERSGHNNIVLFNSDDENIRKQHKLYEWMGNIDQVFSQNRLFVRCQMISSIAPQKKPHQYFEILLGVRNEAGAIIPPDHFIPGVERARRMPEIDQWVIKQVFSWIEENRSDFDNMDGFSINLSGQSINSAAFLDFLQSFLKSSNVPLDKLVFEITETVAAESLVFTKQFIKVIKQLGCKFSLDDFGSGYSSYSYLKNMNVDYLKIDGAFVKDIVNNHADVAIVKSMNEIAHSLGLKTIAEYVENTEILAILSEIGVDYAQGYGIQKPIPLSELVIQTPSSETYYFEDNDFWDI